MIPKTIHYCWFGGKEKPGSTQKFIEGWKALCPDYKIFEWNDDNFSLDNCPQYIKDARSANKFAFVSDYVRLKVLYDHGGIYMDTDVQLLKPLDTLLENDAFIGFENSSFVNSGQILGAKAGHPILNEMMDKYKGIDFYRPDGGIYLLGCPHVNTEVLVNHGMALNGKEQTVANVHIYPSDWFNPLDSTTGELNKTENTVSVHWYSMTWISPWKRRRVKIMRIIRRFFKKITKKR